MPVREVEELRALPDGELAEQLEEVHQALFNLRFQAATRQLADVAQVSQARRRLARVKTLMREREILAEADREAADTAIASEDEPEDEVSAEDEPEAETQAQAEVETEVETETETETETEDKPEGGE